MQEVRRKDFLKRNWEFIDSLVSFLADLFMLNLSFFISFQLISRGEGNIENYRSFLLFINLVFLLLSLGFGIYRSRYCLSSRSLSFSYLHLVLFLAMLTMAFLFSIKGEEYSREIIFFTFLIMLTLFNLALIFFRTIQKILVSRRIIGFKVIIIGTDAFAWKFIKQVRLAFGNFFQILGFLKVENNGNNKQNPNVSRSIIGHVDDLEDVIHHFQPDFVYAVSEIADVDEYIDVYKICQSNSVKLKIVSPSFNHILNHPKIRDVLGISLVFDSWRIYYWRFNSRLKRILDILIALPLLLIFLPLGLTIAALIKLTSKGPVFFRQRRVMYKGGREFYCYKFRSMYVNAEELKKTLLDKNESNGALFKMKKDPRVTPFGRFIRKLSLDELPQFINVLKGEMSIVGPRPLPVEDVKRLPDLNIELQWQKQRGIVKPGLTGLWQILGRSNLPFEEKLFLDLYYIEHQSVFLDLEIIFSTLPSILFGKGAY